MSLILCPTHGESGFCLRFTRQVADAIRSDTHLSNDDLSLFKISLIDADDGKEMFTEAYLLLKKEFNDMGIPDVVSADKEEVYDLYKNALPELAGICAECFREYRKKHDTNMLGFY